ncbi:TetR/AcrR family transcriptional regulator C-terminal domain-containing protein [Desulfitobacterium sp. THU1]|uniref:TetR/AcrR family transcriptional regulator C-terminal domain-containing protein n=1 Tax=Desulfitobacterium sp. THU1 TaxID=3138072 RepID=UPI00311D342A
MTSDLNEIKLHIFHTLGSLLKQTTIDDISTKLLCKESHVSRQTFYRHFQDKYSVANWHFNILAENTLKQVGRTLTWEQAHRLLFTEMYIEKSIYKYAHISNDCNSLSKYSYRSTKDMYIETLLKYKNICPTKSVLFQADAVALFCTQLATKWCNTGMMESPEEFAMLVDSVMPLKTKDLFERDLPTLR